MSIQLLLDPIPAAGGKVRFGNYEDWLQGRTIYGGASALIAYTAAIRAFPDLPPLRSAQIAYIAPTGGEAELRREVIRQGRSATQVRSEIWCEGGCALSALWIFGAEREANAVYLPDRSGPPLASPEDAEPVMVGKGPAFIRNNFELRRVQDADATGKPVMRRWIRLKDTGTLDPISQAILLGDALPPGAVRAMQRPGPSSSMNWTFNLLDPQPATQGGWWLSENASQNADHGYSSERLRMWNAGGRQILDGMQVSAIFG